ncbi:MAG: hypothetical protein ACLQBL_31985 [Polyangiaceae bacterium]
MRKLHVLTWLAIGLVCAIAVACGSNGGSSNGPPGSNDGGSTLDSTVPILIGEDSGSPFGDGSTAGLQVIPAALQTISVAVGASTPTVTFTATLGGQPANAAWSIDQGAIGSVNTGPASATTFTPRGTTGGLATITASLNGQTATGQVFVQLTAAQNGVNPSNPGEQGQNPVDAGALSQGGGVGGVGGEGLGGAVTDGGTLGALQTPTGDAGALGLTLLYPYDKTVWPRGMLAPLLMWGTTGASAGNISADAIQIALKTTSGSFSYTGTFGPPAILAATGGPYIRSPIPQDIWTIATNTAGGTTPTGAVDQLTMSLTIAVGGVGYGPITETWNVAPGLLTGTVYYNSYGTQFVKNWVNPDSAGNPVGAAILGIHSGDLAPHLVVGQNSPLNASGFPTDDTGCRVCHVVSSKGRWVLTESEQGTPTDGLSFLYDLTNQDAGATTLTPQGTFAWAGLTSDGAYALTNAIDPSSTNPAITNSYAGTATSSFWQFGTAPVQGTLTGLASGIAVGYPSYAPDDQFVAFVNATGSTNNVQGPLAVASYSTTTQQFSTVRSLLTPDAGTPPTGERVGYPVFLPDDSALLFENEVRTSTTDNVMVTRNGARSELWWLTLGTSPQAAPLYALNGKLPGGASPYLPILPNNHGIGGTTDPQDSYSEVGWDDTTLNYEPTVLPVVVGGYAWVVFTSRRDYGNQLTEVPWLSWPPDYDTLSLAQAPVKKLWVAAIDLNAPPGTDPSHPAFYLPAQELLAGNSRGFWVLDPCAQNGAACTSGDQCCNGFCEPAEDGGLICASAPVSSTCSGVQDKCTTAADCCDTTNQCINGFCAEPAPK